MPSVLTASTAIGVCVCACLPFSGCDILVVGEDRESVFVLVQWIEISPLENARAR